MCTGCAKQMGTSGFYFVSTCACAGSSCGGHSLRAAATPASQIQRGLDYIRVTYGPQQEDTS